MAAFPNPTPASMRIEPFRYLFSTRINGKVTRPNSTKIAGALNSGIVGEGDALGLGVGLGVDGAFVGAGVGVEVEAG